MGTCRVTIPASRDIKQILDLVASQSGFDTAEEFLVTVFVKTKLLSTLKNYDHSNPKSFLKLLVLLH